MSGYLDVKCPARASRGLGLFKAWKKQWCILRPNPMEENSGVIALHSSFGLTANSTVDLPSGSTVCRTKSRTHQFAFGIFMPGDYRKPHILLAGQTESETQLWMAKIRNVLNGKKHFGRDILLQNSYAVSVIDNEFSRKCLLYGVHGTLTISSHGLLISQPNQINSKIFIAWKDFSNIVMASSDNAPDKNKVCVLSTNSSFSGGAGRLSIFSACAAELVRAVRTGRDDAKPVYPLSDKRISRSEGDLHNWSCNSGDGETAGTRRSSWYSGPSEVSLDNTDLIMTKEANVVVPSGPLLRSVAADDLFPITRQQRHLLSYVNKFSQAYADTPSDRRSCASVASGIYEEILEDAGPPDLEDKTDSSIHAPSTRPPTTPLPIELSMDFEENTYESVAECLYATMRRTGKRYLPPPLPPRALRSAQTLTSSPICKEAWNSRVVDAAAAAGDAGGGDGGGGGVTRHASLGSLPRSCGAAAVPHPRHRAADTLPKLDKNKPSTFNVFRKRIKSDSRVLLKPTETDSRLDDKTAIEPKKKRFDFAVTPSKSIDIIKNFRVSRALMRNLKISSTNLSKLGEAKSCDCLDSETSAAPAAAAARCSKSVERLGAEEAAAAGDVDDDGQDLSLLYAERSEQLSLPHDIVELILKGREDLAELRLRRRELSESDYMPMSPPGAAGAAGAARPPPACEEHYTVMTSPACAPAANVAV